MKYLEKIQGLLPVGYLYLILLGLLKEGVMYYQLGLNVLKYSSLTDILISPISDLSSSPALIILVISVCVLFFIFQTLLVKNSHKNWAQKILGKDRFTPDTDKKEIKSFIFPFFILLLAFELLSIFIGLGIGEGNTVSNKIIKNNFVCNYKMSFNSGKSAEVYVFDSNSAYYFYVTKGSKNIMIAPVGTISSLELINNKKL
jgi:hypothetical protein